MNTPSGHGMSDGERVFIDDFEIYITDSLELMREQRQPGKPFILFGHSMGGLIALHCMLREPDLFSAGVLSSPCLRVGVLINSHQLCGVLKRFEFIMRYILQIHGKYDNTPMRTLAKMINVVAPKLYIPSKSLALDPADVVANTTDR